MTYRPKTVRFRWMHLLVWLVCLSLLACSKNTPHSEIRMALAQAPLNLDPRYASDAASERINRLIYRTLVDFDAHSRPIPDLADWQQISPTMYRFVLKSRADNGQGSFFHDGQRLNADDVVATYSSLLALRDSPHSAEFANIAQVRAIDTNTVEFDLRQPDSEFPARLIIGILPKSLIAQHHDFAHQPIGSGPLKFVAWGNTLKLERIQDHQVFVLQEVKDPTVRVLKLMRGEVDLLQGDLPPELVAYLRQQAGIQVQQGEGANFSYLGFNMQDPVLQKLAVRQAIAHAIDRPAIIQHALVGGSRAAEAILPPEHYTNSGYTNLTSYAYNPALARRLLQQAGVQLPLRLVYKTSTDAQRVRLATIMQAQMQPAGIDLQIHSLDWGTFFDDIKQGKFQLYGLTWVGIKTPEIYRLAFHSDAIPPKGANRGHFHDELMDDLIEKAEKSDAGGWSKVMGRAQVLLPYIPLWYEGQFVAMQQDLTDYNLQPDGNWDGLISIKRRYVH